MTEAEWLSCDFPFDMLCHLDGKVPDAAFIPFSVSCCRRIWPLFTDPRARAVIEATDNAVKGVIDWEGFSAIYDNWYQAYSKGEVEDPVGGITNEALESVCGLGHGHAAQVSSSCFQAAGDAGSTALQVAGAPQAMITAAWREAELAEQVAQCQILRDMFGYVVG